MIGQLGLCLHYFLGNRSTAVRQSPADERAGHPDRGRVLPGAGPARPRGDLVAKKLESDEYLATMIGQVIVDGKVACAAIGEVCFP